MTDDEITQCYAPEDAQEFARDLKMLVLSIMEQAQCSRADAWRYLAWIVNDCLEADGKRTD